MIIEPNLTTLMQDENIDNRYTLVVAAAKRAREIAEQDAKIDKAVKLAVQEIADGRILVIPAEEAPEVALEDIVYKDYIEENEDNEDGE